MKNKSYAQQISDLQVMLSGIKSHQTELVASGSFTETYVSEFENLLNVTVQLNNDQERMKADLSSTTDKLNKNLQNLNKKHQLFKRAVTNEIAMTQWKEFGLKDHRMQKKTHAGSEEVPDEMVDDNPPPPPALADAANADNQDELEQ